MNKLTHLQEWFQLPDETKIRLFAETSRQIGLPSSSATEKDKWEADYEEMKGSMIYDNPLSFDELIKRLTELQKRINEILIE